MVGGTYHMTEAIARLHGLENWLIDKPLAGYNDRLVANRVILDILEALGRLPWRGTSIASSRG